MDAGTRLLLLWIAAILGWVLPVWFLARNAAFIPLRSALLYLTIMTGITVLALVWTLRWFLRGA